MQVMATFIECSLVNACILERYTEPMLCQQSCIGRKKRDFLAFHLDIAEQLIGVHTLRQRGNCQSHHASLTSPRLGDTILHIYIETKARCLVCSAVQSRTRTPNRHESRIQCTYWKVHLCIIEIVL